MRKLLAAAAVWCLAGLAQADDKPAAGAAVDPAHAHTAQPAGAAGASAGAEPARKASAPKKRATSGAAKPAEQKGAAGEKPCEPVKPCPIE